MFSPRQHVLLRRRSTRGQRIWLLIGWKFCISAMLCVVAVLVWDFSRVPSTLADKHTAKESEPLVTIYSESRKDRSGAFLQDMLFAHAYAYTHNYIYGGCCEQRGQPAKFRSDVQKLIRYLGLDSILRFACPNDTDEHAQILSREEYYEQDTLVWSKEWVSYIRGLVRYDDASNTTRKPDMAVHIRRGDVQVCPDEEGRYLPNQHYLHLIEKYRPTPATPVYVYSETESSESWKDFEHDKNIHLELDTPFEEVFLALAQAETIIMSKSSFSLVPAMLNCNKVIYTPFWHKPLPTWTVVPEEIMDETSREMSRLRELHGC